MSLQISDVVKRVRDDIKKLKDAKAHFRVNTTLIDGFHVEASVRGFKLTIDEPESLGGTNKGPNPVELLLISLGSCQCIVFQVYASELGINIRRLSITVEGELDPKGFLGISQVQAGFTDIKYTIDIETDADAEKVKRLKELVELHCPVLSTLTTPAKITSSLRVNGEIVY